ncbi:hypothetical protein AB0K12_01180 [Nonomuraea sp. NPDC049419]|uniref:hypothetical protein n=1 Tax=Nonomuraea sp. NPDC049419 TaxID=3155772 RepID=UPI003424800E
MVSNGSGEREHGTGSAPYGMGGTPRGEGSPADATAGSLFTSNGPAGGGPADGAPGSFFAADGGSEAGRPRRGRPVDEPFPNNPGGGSDAPGSLFMSGSGRHGGPGGPSGPGGPAGPGGPGGPAGPGNPAGFGGPDGPAGGPGGAPGGAPGGRGRHGGGPAGPAGPGGPGPGGPGGPGGGFGGGPVGPPQGGFGTDPFGGPSGAHAVPGRRAAPPNGPGGPDGGPGGGPGGDPSASAATSAFGAPTPLEGADGKDDKDGRGKDGKKGRGDKSAAAGKSRRGRKDRGAAADPETGGDTGKGKPEDDFTNRAPQSRIGWSPYDEGSRSRGPLLAGVGGLVVLGLLGGGLALMYNADDPVTAETAAARQTSAPLPSVPPGKYGFAASRKTDPDPISVKELFGKKRKFTVSKRGYEMTITSKDKKCTDGALGDSLQKALKSAKCTQFVRASFRDKAGVVIGTVGVANLSSEKQAAKVAKAGSTSNYVKPLAGKDEVTKQLGSGAGGAKISTYGHYAILVWFQNKDGTKPDSKGSKRISQAIVDITKATVYVALDNRVLTGNALS